MEPGVAADAAGLSTAVLAIIVSSSSFVLAVIALGWQIAKHFLDGGRVRVYLNTAILEPDYVLTVNRSGRHVMKDAEAARHVRLGGALELAQLVVENPGKVPVTIYSPGLRVTGHGKKSHTFTPRMYTLGEGFGPDEATTKTVVRLEPYGRVTFLLDYWGAVRGVLKSAEVDSISVRGYVGVAGRTKRPQKSSWWKRWKIGAGGYTAIEGPPQFSPLGVIWQVLYPSLPEDVTDEQLRSGRPAPLTRGALHYTLEEAMGRFSERPERKQLEAAINEVAGQAGDRLPVASKLFETYQRLDEMEAAGRLAPWTEGLIGIESSKRVPSEGLDGVEEAQP